MGQAVHESLALKRGGRGQLRDIEDDVDAEVAQSGNVHVFPTIRSNVGRERGGGARDGDFEASAPECAIQRQKGWPNGFLFWFGNGREKGGSMEMVDSRSGWD